MTRIDFYVTPDTSDDSCAKLACRIAEKAYQHKHKVYIYAKNQTEAEQLDKLLWVFRQGSFVPHCLATDPLSQDSAVLISNKEPQNSSSEVLINLSQDVPGFFSRFERVAEIVAGDETVRGQARERFKYYRERGYPLETHELNN